MSIVDIINRVMLFNEFYNGFLLGELKTYINKKTNNNFNDLADLFSKSASLPVLDCILVESFRDHGEQSYWFIFSQLDMNQKEKIMQIVESGKKLFISVKAIDNESEEKYDQYYTMFELIGHFLYNSFLKQGVLREESIETDEDIKTVFHMLTQSLFTVWKRRQVEITNWSSIELPEELNVPEVYKLIA